MKEEIDLIGQYADSARGHLSARLDGIEARLDDRLLSGYRRDGSESAAFILASEEEQVANDLLLSLTGPNQMIVTTPTGDVAVITIPDYGWITKPASGAISAGALADNSVPYRTGDPANGIANNIYAKPWPPGGQMMRTRGGSGIYAADILDPMTPGDHCAELMAGQTYTYNESSTTLSFDGPYLYSSNESGGTWKRFYLPPKGSFRAGVSWYFASPGGHWAGNTTGPAALRIANATGGGTLLNDDSAVWFAPAQRQLVKLMAVGIHGGTEHYVVNAYNIG